MSDRLSLLVFPKHESDEAAFPCLRLEDQFVRHPIWISLQAILELCSSLNGNVRTVADQSICAVADRVNRAHVMDIRHQRHTPYRTNAGYGSCQSRVAHLRLLEEPGQHDSDSQSLKH